jgi:hypothetical protein
MKLKLLENLLWVPEASFAHLYQFTIDGKEALVRSC